MATQSAQTPRPGASRPNAPETPTARRATSPRRGVSSPRWASPAGTTTRGRSRHELSRDGRAGAHLPGAPSARIPACAPPRVRSRSGDARRAQRRAGGRSSASPSWRATSSCGRESRPPNAPPPAPSSPRSTPGSPKASTRATSVTRGRSWGRWNQPSTSLQVRYDCTSLRTVAIGMNSVSGSVGVGSKPKRA